MNHKPASAQSAFFWRTGEPSIFRTFQTSEKISRANSQRVEKARADGSADWTTVVGVSNRSDGILKPQRMYSAPVEGAAAGQRAADKRDALRRGGI